MTYGKIHKVIWYAILQSDDNLFYLFFLDFEGVLNCVRRRREGKIERGKFTNFCVVC